MELRFRRTRFPPLTFRPRARLAGLRIANHHSGARFQAVKSTGGQSDASVHSLDGGDLLIAREGFDLLHRNRLVGIHDVYESAGTVMLNRRGRDQHDVLQRVHE